tara:strand:- start:64 stop:207 length:144 start_codon:yes stop_codon:yes gene_type:complete
MVNEQQENLLKDIEYKELLENELKKVKERINEKTKNDDSEDLCDFPF